MFMSEMLNKYHKKVIWYRKFTGFIGSTKTKFEAGPTSRININALYPWRLGNGNALYPWRLGNGLYLVVIEEFHLLRSTQIRPKGYEGHAFSTIDLISN